MNKSIASVFVKELKDYNIDELRSKFKLNDDEEFKDLIKELRNYSIIFKKYTRNNENNDDIIENNENSNINDKYQFVYVGILIIKNFIIKVYPKYINEDIEENDIKSLNKNFQQIIKVITHYKNRKSYSIDIKSNSSNCKNTLLSLMLNIIQDYHKNGLYNTEKIIVTTNIDNEILWAKTINETVAIIDKNTPYYVDLYSKKKHNDETDYFKRLHKCILTEISNKFKDLDLLNIFSLDEIELTEEDRSIFGDDEYIQYKLEQELRVQFNSIKQTILNNLLKYIKLSKEITTNNFGGFLYYGVTSYAHVWEDICKVIFNNKLDNFISDIEKENNNLFNNKINNIDKKDKLTLKDLIEKPKWWYYEGEEKKVEAQETLEPDCISIINNNFIIIDAKYYLPKINEKNIESQPGIYSITKQFLYQQMYEHYLDLDNIKVFNYFIFLVDDNYKNDNINKVNMPILFNKYKENGIKTIFLTPKDVYENYLTNSPIQKKFHVFIKPH